MALWLILLGVALIDGKLWKIMLEQKAQHKETQLLLAEIARNTQARPSNTGLL